MKFCKVVMTFTEGDMNFTFRHSKMVGIQTSEIDAKLAPVNVGP
jgi:hypothetical protein